MPQDRRLDAAPSTDPRPCHLAREADELDGIHCNRRLTIPPMPDRAVGGRQCPRPPASQEPFRATRFLGFVEDLEPIFRSARIGIVAERIGGGFKLKTLDYIFNRVPFAAIRRGTAGLSLRPGLHYLSFESMRELAQGVACVIDAYEKCNTGFDWSDWSDRGRILCHAIREATSRR
jgi:hypothetical protein